MENIALHGMVSSRNFGDILMVDLTSKYLSQFNCEISVPMAKSLVLRDLAKVDQKHTGFMGFSQCDHLVYAGGGYFGPMKNRKIIKDFKMIAKFSLPAEFFMRNSQHHVIGIGVNSLDKYKLPMYYMKRFFNSAGTIAVRDEESLFELRKIGVVRKDVEVLADIALNIRANQIPTEATDFIKNKTHSFFEKFEKVIAIHLSGLPNDGNYGSIFDGIIKYAKNNINVGFVFIEDHPTDNGIMSPQMEAAKIISGNFENRSLILPYSNHWDLVATLSIVNGIVTNKLHVAIVASALNKVAISFTKHEKNHRFFSQIGASERCVDLMKVDADSVFKMMQHEFFDVNRGEIVPLEVRALAERNFLILQKNLFK